MAKLPAILFCVAFALPAWAQAPGEAAAPAPAAAPEHDPATAPLAGEAEPGADHGAAAAHEGAVHGGQAVHGAEHGGGEHEAGPVIENWFSWDYGPGKAHHHPPFGFAIINFLIYLYILKRLAWASLQGFMKDRHLGVRRALDEAAEVRKKADEQLKRYEERLAGLDAEVAGIVATVRREAEAERARIVAAAEAQAAALQKDAEAQVRAEIERARADLRRQVALAAADAAEAILRSQVQPEDQKRLVDDYVARVESLAGVPPRTPTTPPRPPAR